MPVTHSEIESLTEGSVILDRLGDVWQLRGNLWCSYETEPQPASTIVKKWSPVRILHVAPSARTDRSGRI